MNAASASNTQLGTPLSTSATRTSAHRPAGTASTIQDPQIDPFLLAQSSALCFGTIPSFFLAFDKKIPLLGYSSSVAAQAPPTSHIALDECSENDVQDGEVGDNEGDRDEEDEAELAELRLDPNADNDESKSGHFFHSHPTLIISTKIRSQGQFDSPPSGLFFSARILVLC